MGRWYSQEKSETFAKRTGEQQPSTSKLSYKERIKTKIAERAKIKRLEKEPIVRKAHLKSQRKSIELRRKELDVAREQRELRSRAIRESAPVRSATAAGRGVQRFRQYQYQQYQGRTSRRYYAPAPLGVAPGSMYRDYGAVGSVRPSYSPGPSMGTGPSKLPVHSMGSIRSGGSSYYAPQVDTGGRIPRGIIKSYWSKKVKALAKSNVRKYGPEEGINRTYQMAAELGWKMQ